MAEDVSLIDAHVHLYPPEVNRDPAGWAAAHGEKHWALLCTRKRKTGQPVQTFPDVGALLRSMDGAGVERAILLGWYWEHPETCALQNTFYAACVAAHPDRLSAFATFHPAAGRAASLREVQRAADAGLIGLGELSPPAQGYRMDDPLFATVLERAADLHLPVNLHVTDPASRPYPGKVETPLAGLVRLARAHARTNFILAHWGGRLPLVANEPLPGNLHYDTAASPLLYPETIWREFFNRVPAERVLFGSDHPLNLYPAIDTEPELARLVAEAHRAGLTAGELRGLMGENARRLLRLPAPARRP
ncbi:MAG: amidohydrolase family protein [Opitutales bacterium]